MASIDIFLNPGRCFRHIKEKDDWWIPFFIVVIIVIGSYLLLFPATSRIMMERMASFGRNVDKSFIERLRYINSLSIFVVTFFFWLISALVLWGTTALFGGKINFLKSLDLIAYTSLIGALKSILKLIVVLIRGVGNINSLEALRLKTGLDLFLSVHNRRLAILVNSIDIFNIWIYTLIAFGISDIAGLSKKKSAIVSILTFVILIIVRILLPSRRG